MARRSALLRSVFVLATALSFASCDRLADVSSPAAPSADLLSDLLSQPNYSFKVITESVIPPIDTKVTGLIGIGGGSITLMGHTLTVPSGAVTVPTLFTLIALPNPYVDVEATATVTGLLGNVVDVGIFGFKKPVTLTLTYSRATNVSNPANLFIGYFRSDGTIEPLKSAVDTGKKTVSAQLSHFSKYGMCEN
jgi:hypothetical protein